MLSRTDAVEAARPFLRQAFAYESAYTIVLQPELSEEHPIAWLVRFDSQEHLDTGDILRAPMTRVVIVPKDGSPVHFPPTHLPVDEYLRQLVSGEWPPTKDQ
ncbi:YrhB domain-containing protein [Streptomyces sp. NPDC088400]|uniref:YrhB domain-containing protein n=1 Tax=Streptomyces sp. NPDC088400 TaxID=3365861 RepID=UPI0038173B93